MRGATMLMLVLATTASCATCLPEAVDDVAWACVSSAECGVGARCSDGVCRRVGSGESPNLCPLDVGAGRVTADLHRGSDGSALVLEVNGGAPRSFALPASAKAASIGTCCRSSCCAGLP